MDRIRKQYLDAMEIGTWVRREDILSSRSDSHIGAGAPGVIVPEASSSDTGDAVVSTGKDRLGTADMSWGKLEQTVTSCSACGLHGTRIQTVFGTGNREADWLVIGEAPGADEDRQGEPFVGRAGQLLNAMLLAIGLKREEVYIANILKCRPPNNRDPQLEEVVHCEGFLLRQIQLIQPRVILAVGRIAAQNLLKIDTPIGRMRGRVYSYGEARTPVVITYHPAYLLRSPRQKATVWKDLKLARSVARAGVE
ncbi:MAG: uracil-DNA glycosylase [Gammaproteobacteria bacterium]|nr:uracil-DNA glycosylase [Gammaproteobacteria bacterium]